MAFLNVILILLINFHHSAAGKSLKIILRIMFTIVEQFMQLIIYAYIKQLKSFVLTMTLATTSH